MTAQLHLPDLPEVPIALGPGIDGAPVDEGQPRPPRPPLPWSLRLREAFATYLPLLLMAALAAATWWLVRNAPSAPAAPAAPADAGVPDYTMQRFQVQRFDAQGQLRVRLEGRELHHYVAGDRMVIDELNLAASTGDGRTVNATARRAVSNGAADEISLEGGAEVSGTDPGGLPIRIESEYLLALLARDIVRTHLPVTVTQGPNRLRAGGLEYDAQRRLLTLKPPVRALLQPPPRR